MSKIRVIDDLPVMDDIGNVIHAQVLAGPSDDREAMGTGHLANGTLFLESDTGKLYAFDEDSGWKEQGPKLQAKTATPTASQQTVTADSGYDGLSYVNVSGDENLVAENIKKDVSLFNVVGTYEGSGGGGSVEKKQVNFIDYDGTILYSYTKEEANALTNLPANPSHDGLTAQGWNWTLAQIKSQLTAAPEGDVWVGQMYITDSGDTEIDIELFAPRLKPYIGLAINGTVEIDWGDGTTKSTVTGTSLSTLVTTSHTYAAGGEYTISVHAVSGSYTLYGKYVNYGSKFSSFTGGFWSNKDYIYTYHVKRVRIGSDVPTIGYYALYACYGLTSITIPRGVTSIDQSAFPACYGLTSITIPDGVTSIGDSAFSSCYVLSSVSIPCSVTSIDGSAFTSCYRLSALTIPYSVTTIGNYAFNSTYMFDSFEIPNGVTSIGQNAFGGVTRDSLTLPDSVTTIGNFAFSNFSSLVSLTIPSGVTSIGNRGFAYCVSVANLYFKPTTPPTLGDSYVFDGLPTDCVIHVPAGTLSAYTSAANYPSSATYTYVEDAA